jgi:hypothetical protein
MGVSAVQSEAHCASPRLAGCVSGMASAAFLRPFAMAPSINNSAYRSVIDLADDPFDLKVGGSTVIGMGMVIETGGVVSTATISTLRLSRAENILDPVAFERGDGLCADHAALGNEAEVIEQETFLQPGPHQDQRNHSAVCPQTAAVLFNHATPLPI